MAMSTVTIESLYFDVVDNIFAYLDLDDLINCYGLTPMFQQVAAYHFRRRFQTYRISKSNGEYSSSTPRTLSKSGRKKLEVIGPTLRTLHVHDVCPEFFSTENFSAICPALKHLKVSTFDMCNRCFAQNSKRSQEISLLNRLESLSFCSIRQNDKCFKNYVKYCSNTLTFMQTTVDSCKCLRSIPISLRTLAIDFKRDIYYFFKYLQLNPNLITLTILYINCLEYFDLALLCANMQKVESFRFINNFKWNIINYKALSKLQNLKKLVIRANSSSFWEYPKSLDGNQHLECLHIVISIDYAVSLNQLALLNSFEDLKILELNFDSSRYVTRNGFIPHLWNLTKLECVVLTGAIYNLGSEYVNLPPNIVKLHVSLVPDSVNPEFITELARLKDLKLCLRKERGRSSSNLFMNRLLLKLAKANTVKTLTIESNCYANLDQATIEAIGTFELEHLIIRKALKGQDTFNLLSNLTRLKTFQQLDVLVEPDNWVIKKIRPGKLLVRSGDEHKIRQQPWYLEKNWYELDTDF